MAGGPHASAGVETARRIEDLVVWRLAFALSETVDRMVQTPRARRQSDLCAQIHRSADSVAANLAEGFGRYRPRENARFVRIAKGSLIETQTHLRRGKARDCWTPEDFERAWRLSCRTMKALVPYLRYLEALKG